MMYSNKQTKIVGVSSSYKNNKTIHNFDKSDKKSSGNVKITCPLTGEEFYFPCKTDKEIKETMKILREIKREMKQEMLLKQAA